MDQLFGSHGLQIYGLFVCCILNIKFMGGQGITPSILQSPSPLTQYSIITLNYDLIIEHICKLMRTNNHDETRKKFFNTTNSEYQNNSALSHLAKLHGSADDFESIIPPTWNKGLNKEKIRSAWELAYRLLSEANHIRMIGYSLTVTDSYIKYLLRAAVIQAPHLKQIDVLCLDPDGSVKRNYDKFIDFKNYRFKSASVEDYLKLNLRHNSQIHKSNQAEQVIFSRLEDAHTAFMGS